MKLGEDNIDSVAIRKVVRNSNQTDIEKTISGTYYHPLIIPHIACWVSAEYALRVSEIVIDFHVGEYKSRLDEEQTRRQNAEEWARQEKAGCEAASQRLQATTQILQITEQQVEIMKRELAYADEEVREKDKVLEDKNVEMMEKDKALDDQIVEIARQSAELAVAGLNLLTTKNELGGAKCKILKSKTNLILWSCTHTFAILKVNVAH